MTEALYLLTGGATGVSGLKDTVVNNWIGPIFLIVIAAIGVMLAKDRKIRELAITVVIFAITAVLIFAGDTFFGSSGKLKNGVESIGNTINVVRVMTP